MRRPEKTTTQVKAELWEAVAPLLRAMHSEFKDLSKKQPDAPLSKAKVTFANRLLERSRQILADELSIEFLDLLDEDEVPQHSDAAMVISQHVAAMKQFHEQHYGWNGTARDWRIE